MPILQELFAFYETFNGFAFVGCIRAVGPVVLRSEGTHNVTGAHFMLIVTKSRGWDLDQTDFFMAMFVGFVYKSYFCYFYCSRRAV